MEDAAGIDGQRHGGNGVEQSLHGSEFQGNWPPALDGCARAAIFSIAIECIALSAAKRVMRREDGRFSMGSGTKRNLAYRSNAVRKAWGADPNNRAARRTATEFSRLLPHLDDGRFAGLARVAALDLDGPRPRVGLDLVGEGHVGLELGLRIGLAGFALGGRRIAAFGQVVLLRAVGFAHGGVVALRGGGVGHGAAREFGVVVCRAQRQLALRLRGTGGQHASQAGARHRSPDEKRNGVDFHESLPEGWEVVAEIRRKPCMPCARGCDLTAAGARRHQATSSGACRTAPTSRPLQRSDAKPTECGQRAGRTRRWHVRPQDQLSAFAAASRCNCRAPPRRPCRCSRPAWGAGGWSCRCPPHRRPSRWPGQLCF